MTYAPERIWACPDDSEWISGHWDRAPDGQGPEVPYIRADRRSINEKAYSYIMAMSDAEADDLCAKIIEQATEKSPRCQRIMTNFCPENAE